MFTSTTTRQRLAYAAVWTSLRWLQGAINMIPEVWNINSHPLGSQASPRGGAEADFEASLNNYL